MNYYSTNGKAPMASLQKAVVQGLAEDRGLYMPERIVPLSSDFLAHLSDYSFQEIACQVADFFFGEDVPQEELHALVCDTLSFDVPLVEVAPRIYSLELFHGPTLAFKDVGARFMARLLGHFIRRSGSDELVNVLVATSGDTGSAVANGFLGVPGIHVYVLYPKGKVSPIQECQFTTLGQNITALEVDGVFDDCQALVKSAFMDAELSAHMRLTSANSINVAHVSCLRAFIISMPVPNCSVEGGKVRPWLVCPVATLETSARLLLVSAWGCLCIGSSRPTMPMMSSISICRRVSMRLRQACRP